VEKTENNPQAKIDTEDCLPRESPILNHRLRGPNESFWDAMNQGRAAKGAECSAMIASTIKKTDRT
jgi:hypothetical protein